MQTKHFFYYLAVLAMLFTACKESDDLKVKKDVFGGYAQKGPFVNGSSVTISELNAKLDQTGRTYNTVISDNSGRFEQKNIKLVSNYVELKADGYYFHEVWGTISQAPITLYALADVKDINSVNVNVLTHLEKSRVEYLVKQERKSFSEAKQQAQHEVLAIFGFEPPVASSEALNLTDNAVLLAVSCILQGRHLSAGDIMELMANVCADIKTDGTLDNMALGTKLINNAYDVLSVSNRVRDNLTAKYTELGNNVPIPDFESCIQSFTGSDLYSHTSYITYPEIGLYGENILLAEVYSGLGMSKGSHVSMKAIVPKGMSLRIVMKDGLWSYTNPLNWSAGTYDYSNQCQEFIVTESGKASDLQLYIESVALGESHITIELYENGSVTPIIKKMWIRD